jgi:hypothetical protein
VGHLEAAGCCAEVEFSDMWSDQANGTVHVEDGFGDMLVPRSVADEVGGQQKPG